MTIDEIVTLIQAVSDNGLTSFSYEAGEEVLVLKKKNAVPAPIVYSQPVAPVMSPVEMVANAVGMEAVVKPAPADIGSDKVVVSPLVGTFYNAASPEAEVFVKVGDTVKKGQVLGIIEAMKLMNEIESEFDGVIEAVLVNNEEVVEYGQPLFRIR